MKVTMLRSTCWEGKRLKAGKTVEVEESVAERWIANKIAKAA